jgi:hypothetical protein
MNAGVPGSGAGSCFSLTLHFSPAWACAGVTLDGTPLCHLLSSIADANAIPRKRSTSAANAPRLEVLPSVSGFAARYQPLSGFFCAFIGSFNKLLKVPHSPDDLTQQQAIADANPTYWLYSRPRLEP